MTTQDQEVRRFINTLIEHFPDRSARWLFQNKENVRGLLEIIANDLVDLIDFNQLVPINRSFIAETLREQEADILFRVPFKSRSGTDSVLIYILIEHQSSFDPTMGFRVLFYMMIWDAERREAANRKVPRSELRLPPILPIVFYTGDQHWGTELTLKTIMDVPEELSRFVPSYDSLLLSVKEADEATLTRSGHPLGWLLTVLQKEKADKETLRRALIDALSHFEGLGGSGARQRQEAIGYLLLLILHRRVPAEHDELITLIDRHTRDMEVEPMAQTMAEMLLERGIAQGIEQGIEQGARQSTIENIIAVLNARFPDEELNTLKIALEAIGDLERLKQLILDASLTPSFEAFQRTLDT